jgi:hypothetical protein
VRMICKAGFLRDGCNSIFPTSKFAARPRDPTPSQILPHRVAEPPPKELRQVHGMYTGDACHACEPVDLHRMRVKKGDTSIESLTRLEKIAARVSTSGIAHQHDCFFNRERMTGVSFLEFAPRAHRYPLNVTVKHAAHEGRAESDPLGELAPHLWIKFDVERGSAATPDFVRVGFLIVKDHRAAAALTRMKPCALDVTAAEHVGEEGCWMSVLRQPRAWIVCSLESMQTGLGENPSNAPGCRCGGSFIGWATHNAPVLDPPYFLSGCQPVPLTSPGQPIEL